MTNSSSRDASGDLNNSGQGINHEAVKVSFDAYSERLVDSGKGCPVKGKGKASDMLPPLPLTASSDYAQGSAAGTMMEATQLVQSNISCHPTLSQCEEVDDVSTESDELPAEGNEAESGDVTRDLIHSVEGHSSSSNACRVRFLGLKENKVDGGKLTHQQLDNKGSVKACSCSFCLKAAHMWTDLTFQDTRGRLAELQRSKKRTKDYIVKVMQDPCKTSKSSKLETDLLQQWTALFQHTHDTLVQEIAQTQSKLEAESKMMESCKKELETWSNLFPRGPCS